MKEPMNPLAPVTSKRCLTSGTSKSHENESCVAIFKSLFSFGMQK
jgi:hypothetical protein